MFKRDMEHIMAGINYLDRALDEFGKISMIWKDGKLWLRVYEPIARIRDAAYVLYEKIGEYVK
jgi:hypothetical protein